MKGLYDIHTHIIPHVDDGADTIEITKKILQMEYNDGVQTIFATSHFRRRMFETPMEKIRQQYLQVQQVAKEIAPDLRLILVSRQSGYGRNSECGEKTTHGRYAVCTDRIFRST